MPAKRLRLVYFLLLWMFSQKMAFAQDTMLVNPKTQLFPEYDAVLYTNPGKWSRSAIGLTAAFTFKNGFHVLAEAEGIFAYNPRFYRFFDFNLDTSKKARIGYIQQNRLALALRMPWGVYSKNYNGRFLGIRLEQLRGLEVLEFEPLNGFDFERTEHKVQYTAIHFLLGASRALRYNNIIEGEVSLGYRHSHFANGQLVHGLSPASFIQSGPTVNAHIRFGFGMGKNFTREATESRFYNYGLGLDFTTLFKNGISLFAYMPAGDNNLFSIHGTFLKTETGDIIKATQSETTFNIGLGYSYYYFLNQDGKRMGNYIGGQVEKRYARVGIELPRENTIEEHVFYPNLFSFKTGHLNALGDFYLVDLYVKSGITLNRKSHLKIFDYVENNTGFYTSIGVQLGIIR